MFLDNQGQEPVWFDSLYIKALKPKKALIVQENHYDPYGNPILPLHYLAEAQALNPSMYQGKELDSLLQAYDFEARLYDPLTGRFMSSDPADQFASGYTGMGNNPVIGVDPDGRMAWFVPVLIGAAIGGTMGGIKAVNRDMSFMGGFLKGAIVGAVGGAASLVGGGPFITNVAYGIFEGAMVGALDAAVWGDDMGKGAFGGAVSGAAFATVTSSNMKNLLKGQGFRSNEKVLASFVAQGQQQKALDYFGFGGKYEPEISGPGYSESKDYFGVTKGNGEVSYGNMAFTSYDNLKATYYKELYTSLKYQKGISISTQEVFQGMDESFRVAPEEALGFIDIYKKMGLFPKTSIDISSQINFYQNRIFDELVNPSFRPKWWHFIYKIPRRF